MSPCQESVCESGNSVCVGGWGGKCVNEVLSAEKKIGVYSWKNHDAVFACVCACVFVCARVWVRPDACVIS